MIIENVHILFWTRLSCKKHLSDQWSTKDFWRSRENGEKNLYKQK